MKRILIVDDSPQFRAVAAELLLARGFEVLGPAENGEQALAAAAGECPDGILVDINPSGLDGFAVCAALAAACPEARMVLTSAEIGHVPAWILKTCFADTFIAKEELAAVDLRALFAG